MELLELFLKEKANFFGVMLIKFVVSLETDERQQNGKYMTYPH